MMLTMIAWKSHSMANFTTANLITSCLVLIMTFYNKMIIFPKIRCFIYFLFYWILSIFNFFFYFSSAGDQTHGLMHARKEFYHWETPPVQFSIQFHIFSSRKILNIYFLIEPAYVNLKAVHVWNKRNPIF
jgi:hypothetical protein